VSSVALNTGEISKTKPVSWYYQICCNTETWL